MSPKSLISFIHFSKDPLKAISESLMTVIVHGSNILSPANLTSLPLYCVITGFTVEAGIAAPEISSCCEPSAPPYGNGIVTLNWLGRAPPSAS